MSDNREARLSCVSGKGQAARGESPRGKGKVAPLLFYNVERQETNAANIAIIYIIASKKERLGPY